MRVGTGYDVHAFDPARPLVLGGVTIEGAPGLSGWSDADVLSHAIADALLGAAALGDLGDHFPAETVPKGSSSLQILARTSALLADAGLKVVNVDSVVVAEEVRVSPHRREMSAMIAQALSVNPGQVSVKATSTDHLGFTGRGEGIGAIAVALVE